MSNAIRLLTFKSTKYGEQVIAVDNGPGQFNTRLFDVVGLLIYEDTASERKRVEAQAEEFATAFVEQMNAGADEIERLRSLLARWSALDAGAWAVERHAREKDELLTETRAAIAAKS